MLLWNKWWVFAPLSELTLLTNHPLHQQHTDSTLISWYIIKIDIKNKQKNNAAILSEIILMPT